MGFTAGLRALGIAALGAVSVLTVAAPSVAAAGPSTAAASPSVAVATAAGRVVAIAEAQRGKAYAFGAAGPSAFDCSGLVRYAYEIAGVNSRLGGGHSGYAMLSWAVAHHLFSRSNPQVGDVVIYGNGAHVGIYIGGGKVISALNPRQGIMVTALHALGQPVTGFVHTHLGTTRSFVVASTPARTAKVASTGRTVQTRVFVNLRAGASTASHVVAVVRPGVSLRLLGATIAHGARWDHVAYAGRIAWVRADLVGA